MDFLASYALFLAKTITGVAAILGLVLGIIVIAGKGKGRTRERLEIKHLNEKYEKMRNALRQALAGKSEFKAFLKRQKAERKQTPKNSRKRIFVLNFKGDIKASAVKSLREEITAILTLATTADEVFVRLESHGGMMHAYGLAASQLQRIRQKGIKLTVSIDQIAASGGYMMACVANDIIAGSFAIAGSIGVIAQFPNFHRLLKKNEVEFEQITAGEYKRTLTLFGENTEKGRQKFREEIEDAHTLFKNFIHENRPQVDIEQVATGEHWYGIRALERKLIDAIQTSDDYLLSASEHADIYEITYLTKKSLTDKIGLTAQAAFEQLALSWRQRRKTTFLET